MKNLFCILLLLFAGSLHAQNISGFYSGKLVNDSTKKEQQYELALSEYRGKITGYSYTTFIVNDSFYYSVKRVKAERVDGALEVEDVKMLGNNFPQQPDKGVRQIIRIPLNEQDSITELKGSWKTTQTKRFYSIGGEMAMQREKDSSRLALVSHLYDIGEWQKPVYRAPEPVVAKAQTKQQPKAEQTVQPPAQKPESPVASAPVVAPKTPAAKNENKEVVSPKPAAPAVLAYNARAEQVAQTYTAVSDSLVLSFYDNGVVDGDTISVYLNEVNIISKVKLTAAAARQTIRLDQNTDTYKLILVAENLGTIPPNTGLLVIQDGSQRFQVNFTADLQTNAAIVFKKAVKKEIP